ncbi:MAG: 3-deoxy-D-manno-octulosonic acid transferase [Ignavibacteria bacterium]|nr:3-deoxy-D-manno-octulosonic acid transferase [Ignavibacteria bacterium]
MLSVWQAIYSVLILPLLWISFQISGLFNAKIRRGIRGRDGLLESLKKWNDSVSTGMRIWIHSSSMGEFEQAKPIIGKLRRQYPDLTVLVSFFSPSGLENSRNYPLADYVTYIPFDSHRNARRFIDLVRPDLALFVRYDLWPNHIWELKRRNIPVCIVNATLSRLTIRRLPFVRGFHRSLYNALEAILTVSGSDAETYRLFGLTSPRIEVMGDTRFDQVSARCQEAKNKPFLPEQITKGRRVLIGGSCWHEDDAVLFPAFFRIAASLPEALLIYVPHEPTERHLTGVAEALRGRALWCRLSAIDRYQGEPVIVVDSIGKLLALYAEADVAFIGGSFGQGIHNVLEAAVFGIPVVFGPRHQNSQEPLELVEIGGAFVVANEEEMVRTVGNLLDDQIARDAAGRRSSEFVARHTGATDRLVSRLAPFIGTQALKQPTAETTT